MKPKMFTFFLFLILFFSFSYLSQAQLAVQNNIRTPAQLTVSDLVGAGIVPTDITFNGAPANVITNQVGRFSTGANNTNLGIATGVIICTGNARGAIGPNNFVDYSSEPDIFTEDDPDLAKLVNNDTLVSNVSILEFDFIATGSTLNFDYVFASEEYPEYVNDTFNDSFGFFLSGPGITGPYTNNAKNIALIPNTNLPVTTDNVNNGNGNTGPCTNCEFYVSNGDGETPNINRFIQYDGFTKVLRATSDLQCGKKYHIKIAIGNIGDETFDSAVFLKNFSIQLPPLELLDSFNLNENLMVCGGSKNIIKSGFPTLNNTFVWSKDNVIINGQTGPDLEVSESGVYKLDIYDKGGCLIGTDTIKIVFKDPFNNPERRKVCAISPFGFNLNQNAIIAGTLNVSDYKFSYYDSSYNDAFTASTNGLIPDPNNYATSIVPRTIWVRVENILGPLCVVVKSFEIDADIAPSGTISYPKSPFCYNNSTLEAVTSNATTGGVFSATPAGLNINPTTGAINPSLSTPGDYTVFYNLPATLICAEFNINTPVSIRTIQPPVVNTPLSYCFKEKAPVLTATTSGGGTLLWYDTATDPVGSTIAPVPNTNKLGTQTYFVSQISNGCESTKVSIAVDVVPGPDAPIVVSPLAYCINSVAPPLTAQATQGATLLWYDSRNVLLPSAPVPNTSSAGSVTYFVSQVIGNCTSVKSTIVVNTIALPNFNLPQDAVICVDKDGVATEPYLLESGLDPLLYTFEWFKIEGTTSTSIPNETGNSYNVTTAGTYGLIVKTIALPNCSSKLVTTQVKSYAGPVSISVDSSGYFSNERKISVTVLPSGNYEYQLDDGVFQPSNVFTNVAPGKHVINVNELGGCGNISTEATIVSYPNFFTPNNDGIHDTWNIFDLKDQPKSVIYIFDRFGKLMKQISPAGSGWDGRFNSYDAPESDYWFTVTYDENEKKNQIFKAHFSLKRSK
jgi:gliding motility-associated-like protein